MSLLARLLEAIDRPVSHALDTHLKIALPEQRTSVAPDDLEEARSLAQGLRYLHAVSAEDDSLRAAWDAS